MTRARALLGAFAAPALLVGPIGPADAAEITTPPALADLDRSAVNLRITDVDVRVQTIDPRVTELETEVDDTSVTLNSDILFGFDEATVTDAAAAAIEDVVAEVPDGAAVTIAGHTDDVGADDYNEKLSTQRARAVARIVRTTRPDLDLTVEGHGSADPVEPNEKGGEDNPAGRAKNRRVEITWQ